MHVGHMGQNVEHPAAAALARRPHEKATGAAPARARGELLVVMQGGALMMMIDLTTVTPRH
eukprot:217282-Chlamydomonas_euryale.AAC.1